jgi:hypothetical protein
MKSVGFHWVIKTLLFLITCFSLFTCGENRQEHIRHQAKQEIDSILHLPGSVLYVPITYSLLGIEELLNEKLKGNFLSKDIEIEDKKAELKIELTLIDRIKVKWNQPELSYSIALNVSGLFKKKFVGITIKNHTPVETNVILHLKSNFSIDHDWKLVPATTLDSITWLTDPKLNMAFIELNLKGTFEKFIEKNQTELLVKIDEAVTELIQMDKIITKVWKDVQKPIRINKEAKEVWLKIYGENIDADFSNFGKETLGVIVKLNSKVFVNTNLDAFPRSNLKLPRNNKVKIHNDSLDIYVHASISIDEIKELLHQNLHDKEFSYAGYRVKLDSTTIFSSENKIIIRPKITGDIDATIFLAGHPSYNHATKTITIDEFNYEVSSENLFLNITAELLYEEIIVHIKDKLIIDLSDELEKLPEVINQAIDHSKVSNKISISFSSLDVSLENYILTMNDLQLVLRARGKADLVIQDGIFTKKK